MRSGTASTNGAGSGGGPAGWVRSTCPYCGVGCGVEAKLEGGGISRIRGDGTHPANFGKLCPKPAGLPEALSSPDRLRHPQLRRPGGELARTSWETALGAAADRLSRTLGCHGPGSVAFYISGQLLTEDYYAVNKLAKGFLGTNNVDSNSRLCMSSAVAGYTGAFGSDGPPASYADITHADCLVLWGSNTADCHPVTFGRIRERKRDPRVSVVVIDPRRTATAEIADIYLPVRPGTDLVLANALLTVLDDEDLLDGEFIDRHTTGFAAALAAAREWPPERAAAVCGLEAREIRRAARAIGEAGAAMILWTMGLNQSTSGTLNNRAVMNLCLATGNIGRRGAGPFSLTGQPNAMGGREVGGLAHLLPGYRLVKEERHRREVEELWGVPDGSIAGEPGLTGPETFRALERGEVKFLWVAATNPLVSMPDLAQVRRAMAAAEYVVVQDAYPTETTAHADLVLPAAGWGEKSGVMTNSERRVSMVEKLVEPPGAARPDWEIFAALARRMGYGRNFGWEDSAAVYAEYRELTRGTVVDVTGLSHERLRRGPVQWPCPDLREGSAERQEPTSNIREEFEHPGTVRLYADRRFNTPDGRARFAATPPAGLYENPSSEYPLTLSTGRIKAQWHTMTRTGRSKKLMRGLDGPFVELHRQTARAAGVVDGEAVRVASERGSFEARARLVESLEQGTVFAPFHWGELWTAGGSVNRTTHSAACPTSGQPELKGAAVRVEPVRATGSKDTGVEENGYEAADNCEIREKESSWTRS